MNFKDFSIRFLRRGYHLFSNKKFLNPTSELDRQIANDLIYDKLMDENPCMISRFGTTELISLNNYLCIKSKVPYLRKIWNFISDKTHTPWWYKDNFKFMNLYSGVFPANQEIISSFCERYLNDIPLIDILGSFQYYEKFMPLSSQVKYLHLETLYPFFVEKPWTLALKGKKVLVVHPFEDSIKYQYGKREQLFDNEDILPDYELITLRAIQSVGGTEVSFNNWFEALKFMEDRISEIQFDICILGCGAYGLPLAAYVKRMGKKAIHIGGGLQLLYGIKGKRWDDVNYGHEYNLPILFPRPYNTMYNKNWIKPLNEDTPQNANKVDNACYW